MRTFGWLGLAGLALVSACTSILGDFDPRPDDAAGGATSSTGSASTSSSTVASSGAPTSSASSSASSGGSPSSSSSSSASSGGQGGAGGGETAGTGGGGAAPIQCTDPTPDLCGSTCTDLTADPSNCGRCGHSCQGGDCTDSVCQPLVISSPTYYANALAVDSKSVYWIETLDAAQIASNGSVKKAPLLGGGSYTLLAAQQSGPFALAVNASGVFSLVAQVDATPGGLVWLAPGSTTPTPLATNFTNPGQLGLSTTNVYWFDSTNGAAQSQNLLSLNLATLSATSMPMMVSGVSACVYAPPVLNKGNIFWMQSGCFANSGTVQSATLSPLGGAVDLLPAATFLNGPYSGARIAIDANNVYFGANNSSGVASIESVSLTGGNLSVVFSASPNGIAMDSKNFYWTDNVKMAVLSRPIAGGMTKVLADNQTAPDDIVVDSTSVYWTNNSNPGSVMKIAKP